MAANFQWLSPFAELDRNFAAKNARTKFRLNLIKDLITITNTHTEMTFFPISLGTRISRRYLIAICKQYKCEYVPNRAYSLECPQKTIHKIPGRNVPVQFYLFRRRLSLLVLIKLRTFAGSLFSVHPLTNPPPPQPLHQQSHQPKTNATRLAAIAEYFAKSLGKQISASLICNNLLERIHQRWDFAPFPVYLVKSGCFHFIILFILIQDLSGSLI